MKNFVNFFHEVGKLKDMPRRGWVLIGVKDPASVADHSFRMALMAWVLGRKKKEINFEKAIKMALVHDLCEIYSKGMTPYDYGYLPKDKKDWPAAFDKLPRFSKSKKIKNFLKKEKRERDALLKITKDMPEEIKKEILHLWHDYTKGTSKEAIFVRQINRLETLLQAFEYGKESNSRPFNSWWIGSEEQIDDPVLIECMLQIAEQFYHKGKPKRKKKK
jgi:5'-deoxynucleotidase